MIFIVYALHKITLLPIQDQGDQLPRQNLFSADCKYLELKKCTILLKVKRKTIKFMDLIFFSLFNFRYLLSFQLMFLLSKG